MIPHETVDRILDAAQIADVVGDFVTLKRRGANFTACCPFHNEKTPSFYVSPSKGIYKCFGCGKSGTAVGFVMEHERLSYAEALKYLAKKYNIEVVEKEVSAEELALRQRNESLLLVSEFAGKFFRTAFPRKMDGPSAMPISEAADLRMRPYANMGSDGLRATGLHCLKLPGRQDIRRSS